MDTTLSIGPTRASLPLVATLGDELSKRQWKILMAFMNTVVPAIRCQDASSDLISLSTIQLSKSEYSKTVLHISNAASSEASSAALEAYLAERPSDNPLFEEVLRHVLSYVPLGKKKQLQTILSVLSTCAGSLLLTGYTSPITKLPVADRIKILHSWRTSSLWALRGLFKTLTTLGKHCFMRTSTTFDRLTGFQPVPLLWTAGSSYAYQFKQLAQPPLPPSSSKNNTTTSVVELETDVVIVGSGCGAGVCAWRLSRNSSGGPSGVRVLVVEKSRHFDASHFPMSQEYGLPNLFEAGGVIETDDGSMTVTAGSCFGGGGTVNWSAALQTQDFVRKEWAEQRSLPFFTSPEFQTSLDLVCEIMGVSSENLTPNYGNQMLLDGAGKLGYEAKIVPQNCGNTAHNDGHCTLGCGAGEKKGPVNGWFPEAAQNGTEFIEGMRVNRVLFDQIRGKKIAKGVEGFWSPNDGGVAVKVVVKAKKVVISGGTLWSPVVLMNSGLKNPHIGKNLYLHPTQFVAAVWEQEVRPWEGGSLTSVVSSFENMDGKGHGVKLEAMSMLPSFCLPFLPWAGGLEYKLLASKYRHMNVYIAICRDRDTGRIYRDPDSGVPRIDYCPSDFDRAHNFVGIVSLAKILFAQGAKEIHPCLPGLVPFVRGAIADATAGTKAAEEAEESRRFETWLHQLEGHGNKPPAVPFATAHQMGTCRMSAKERDGVVDPRGRVWGIEGLYVADASVFPSASGVNPMVTIMAIADHIAQGVIEDLAADGKAVPVSRL
ncbi:hypothetical protein B0H63DRAFT_433208 [Podospora didyma]|uniref:Long-chain-alcohol oxidase n=1 Tax=Podospora didyma TaxID=330526 RepID=A0AAE0NPU3_9PEZI|nr:hypothetical protein B0H63DRAFT_433208 [Podospora didyma]